MVQLQALTKAFGERVLLDEVTWQVTDGERVGLAGPNGAGKTTLLRMLAGLDQADRGAIIRPAGLTVGYLPQDGLDHHGRTLADEASLAFQPLLDAKREIEQIEHDLADPSLPEGEHETLLVRYHDLTDFFRREEGHSIDLRVTQVLEGLGFNKADFGKPTETFSGGWQMRIALAKLLLIRPTLLLLDEPTNHLDLDARNWLEGYLSSYPHAVILVSHDRFFLDSVVTRISEISLRTITDYTGTYSQFLIERDARLERLRQAKREQVDEVARMRAFIDRFRYQATKAAQVQSRIKMLDRVVPIEVPPERKRVRFTFPTCPKSGRIVLELERVRKAYGTNVVLDRIGLHVERGDRIALVAPNGAGKSTLMRLLAGVEAPDTGTRREGHQVVMQYFAQDEASRLEPEKSVYEVMESDSPVGMVPVIRNILGGFLFSGDDIYKRAGVLSGGERTRLAVARMLLRPANTLLLDEPTNHLDLDSKDVLLDALEDFGGTLIFVSHDRYFVDKLATKIIAVGHGGIEIYPGTYEEFLWSRAQREQATIARTPPVKPPPAKSADQTQPVKTAGNRPAPADTRPGRSVPVKKPTHAPGRAASYEDKKKADAESRRRRRAADDRARRIADLEARIATRESEIREIEARMATPGFYDQRDEAETVVTRHQTLMWEVGDLMNQWEALQAQEVSD
ncbi:MAG TPA: ABC-F family ATP-binding cassette domain-containing protein [Vicinamibacterales bacterium]|nr:ABC-F family ATP-binding cassette domain-containing protein [Vicinamibacterales bacterium]